MAFLNKPIIFFDFDNTITCVDVLGAVIERFSINNDWKPAEVAWRSGQIGSRECLEIQLKGVRVKREDLIRLITNIPIDHSFVKLLGYLNQNQIPSMIVSDSFSWLIQTVLNHHGIPDIPVFANRLEFERDRLIPSFPFLSPDCPKCAHCKKIHLLKNAGKTRIYVGDGMSDVCPAMEAEIVFAKSDLAQYLEREGKSYFPFQGLETVHDFFLNRSAI